GRGWRGARGRWGCGGRTYGPAQGTPGRRILTYYVDKWKVMRFSLIQLGILAHNLALISGLLDPLHAAAAGTPHRAGESARPGAGGHEHGIAAAPGGVDGGAVV